MKSTYISTNHRCVENIEETGSSGNYRFPQGEK